MTQKVIALPASERAYPDLLRLAGRMLTTAREDGVEVWDLPNHTPAAWYDAEIDDVVDPLHVPNYYIDAGWFHAVETVALWLNVVPYRDKGTYVIVEMMTEGEWAGHVVFHVCTCKLGPRSVVDNLAELMDQGREAAPALAQVA